MKLRISLNTKDLLTPVTTKVGSLSMGKSHVPLVKHTVSDKQR